MGELAVVFPGQGSQFVGMGADLSDFPEARTLLEADPSLARLMGSGPAEDLKQTVNTQPAVVSHSLALWAVLSSRGLKPAMVAGHSVGEYAALVAGGALDAPSAIDLVRVRAKAMQTASEERPGSMAALIGADPASAEELCRACGGTGSLEVANLNSPGQVVVSGSHEGLRLAGEKAREFGIRRVMPLAVGGAFHSTLMEPAVGPLSEAIERAPLKAPVVPLVANRTAAAVTEAAELRRALQEQVVSRVLWEDSVRTMIAAGVTRFVEVGPGKVLAGMIRKIDGSVEVWSINDATGLEQAVSALR